MFKKVLQSLLVMILVFGLFITGCQKQEKETAPAPEEQTKITVTDGLGREITLDGPVERIATNYGIASHMVFALGAQDRLVGIDSPSQGNEFFNALMPETAEMETAGSPKEVNVEQIIALKPDLVLVPGRNKELVENLEQNGLIVFGVVAEDLEQLESSMTNLGKALGCEEAAGQFASYYEDTMKLVQDRTAGLDKEDKPVVYLAGPMGALSTCSADMYQNYLIDLCGGRNAGSMVEGDAGTTGWIEVSPEQILQWNPDIILVVQYGSCTPEDILADSRLQTVNAVKNKQVFWFPSKFSPWDYPSPQAVLGITWLAAAISPDQFTDINIQGEVDKFYTQFYGKSFTELGGTM